MYCATIIQRCDLSRYLGYVCNHHPMTVFNPLASHFRPRNVRYTCTLCPGIGSYLLTFNPIKGHSTMSTYGLRI